MCLAGRDAVMGWLGCLWSLCTCIDEQARGCVAKKGLGWLLLANHKLVKQQTGCPVFS
jgi:hypothetical protein